MSAPQNEVVSLMTPNDEMASLLEDQREQFDLFNQDIARPVTPTATLVSSSWSREANGTILVSARVQSHVGGLMPRLGFIAIGYNASDEAVEVVYTGNNLQMGLIRDFQATLTAGSQIERIEVVPMGNGERTDSVDLLATGYRRENGQITVTGVLSNGTAAGANLYFLAIGYDANGQIVEVRSTQPHTIWAEGSGAMITRSVTLTAGLQIDRVEVVPMNGLLTGSMDLLETGHRLENDRTIVTTVVQNGRTGSAQPSLMAVGYNANGEAIEVRTVSSTGFVFSGKPATYTITLNSGQQVDHVEVFLIDSSLSGTGLVDLLASGYYHETVNRAIATGVVRNAMNTSSRIGMAVIAYNADFEVIEVGYAGSTNPVGYGNFANYTVNLNAGDRIHSVAALSPFTYLDNQLGLIEKGYYMANGTIQATAAIHNDREASERVVMTVRGYDANDQLVRSSNTTVSIGAKHVSRLSGTLNAAGVERVEIVFDADGLVDKFHSDMLRSRQLGMDPRFRGCEDVICQYVGDPVDIINGNLTWEYTDFEVYGAQRLSFERFYNSQSTNQTTLGIGWRHRFEYSFMMADNVASVVIPNGFAYGFIKSDDGSFIPETALVSLERTSSGYVFTAHDSSQIRFDEDGNVLEVTDVHQNQTTFSYDRNGQLERVSNRTGHFTFIYEDQRIVSIVDHIGRRVYYEYDSRGNLITFINADGDRLTYTYDGNSNLLTVSDFNDNIYMENVYQNHQVVRQYLADQGVMTFEYDLVNRVTIYTDQNGEATRYYYDEDFNITHTEGSEGARSQVLERGLLKSSTDERGDTTEYAYDDYGNRITIYHPDGTTEHFEYNDQRLMTKAIARDGSVTLYEYDERSNVTKLTDARGGIRRFVYDQSNNLLSYTNANLTESRILGRLFVTRSFTYDERGNRITMTDARGTTQYEYDELGRLIAETSPMGETYRFEYSPAGKLLKITNPLGEEQTFEVNGNGFTTGVIDFGGRTTSTVYDGMNNPISVTDPEGNVVAYRYDGGGNLIELTDILGYQTTYTYDDLGRLTHITDPRGHTWRYQYTLTGQLEQTIDPYGHTANMVYDAMGRPTKTTNERGAKTHYVYDEMGRVISIVDALESEKHFVYDQNDNLIQYTDQNGQTWIHEYDAENQLIKTIDPLGGKTLYEYDMSGQLIRVTSPEGFSHQTAYDRNGRAIRQIDPLNQVTETIYDALGRVTQLNHPDGTSVTFDYDSAGLLTSTTDEQGNKTSFTYNANGQILTMTDALEGVTTHAYDANGRLTSMTNALGGVTAYTYDANGNLLTITDPMGGVTTYEYDRHNRVVVIEDAMEGRTTFKYDEVGNLIEIQDAEGDKTIFEYDLLDRQTVVTDAVGNTFSTTYDANGNVRSQTDGRGHVILFGYDEMNRLTTVTDQNGGIIQYMYDQDGRRVKVINQEGAETHYQYDEKGQVIVIADAYGNETHFDYDERDRLIKITDANRAATTYTYTATGLLETVTDALGGISTHEYDALGRLVRETNANNETTTYTYDALGRVLSVTNPLGYKETFTYDALGRITTVTDRNGLVTTYRYDQNSNLISTTDALGVTSFFEYDALGRLVKARLSDSQDQITLYEYDGRGLMTRVINAVGDEQVFVYDANGNLVRQVDEDGHVTEYAYDAMNLAQSITYSDGRRVNFAYNSTGQLIEMEDWTGTTTFSHDLLGRLTTVQDGNDNLVRYGYDPMGNQTSISYPNGTEVQHTFDALNRLTDIVIGQERTTYMYDAVGRLVETRYPNGVVERRRYDSVGQVLETTKNGQVLNRYSYDPVGNVLSDSRVTPLHELELMENTHNSLNQLTARTVRDVSGELIGHYEYVYDRRGNMVEAIDLLMDQRAHFTYDATNRMVSGVNVDGEISQYTYNGLGDVTSHNGIQQIPDYTSDRRRVLQDGNQTFVYGIDLISVQTPQGKEYVQTDRLGSVTLGTDATGVIQSQITYDAWGVPTVIQQGLLSPNYTGLVWDETLEVYHAKARMYDPHLQRFLAVDPVRGTVMNPQTMNPYLYVLNNPLRYVDLMGLTPSEVAGGGSFASEIVRELERTGQYPSGWGGQELHSFAHRYDEELQWIARHARNASELAFLSDKTLAFDVPLGARIELQRMLNRGVGLGEVETYFAEAVFCLQDRGDWFLGVISWDAYEAYIATRGGSTANQLFGFSLMESSGQMTAMNRWNTNGMIRQRANPSNRLENDLFADSWYGRTRSVTTSESRNTGFLRLDLQFFRTKKTSYEGVSRSDAFRQAKRDADVPMSQQPRVITRPELTENGQTIMRNGRPVLTRQYEFRNTSGEPVFIQDHSWGHTIDGRGPHFNVRPLDNLRTGHFDGTHGHYNFSR
jgi:RHS repeat-associated protein